MMLLGFDRHDVRMAFNLARLGVRDRFLGSTLGLVWVIFNPVLMFGIFTIVFQVLFISGLGLFLAALNVFVRDVFLVLPNVLLLVLFASPIFYPIEAFPSVIRPLVLFNPFYVVTEAYRAPLIRHSLPLLWTLVYLVILAVLVFWAGLGFFRRLKSFFDSRL